MNGDEVASLRRWLAQRLQAQVLCVEDLVRHAEGFSWETYTFGALWRGDRGPAQHGFALRREPEQGLLPPYDASRDHRLHHAIAQSSDLPLPTLRWLETDPEVLSRPFYLMDRVVGTVPVPWAANDPRVFPDQAARQQIGEDFIDVLADIHTIDVDRPTARADRSGQGSAGSSIADILGDPGLAPDQLARAQIAAWAAVVEDAGRVREPVLDAAILWLERNVATSGRRTLVHGDYRIGNFMVGADGHITAVFDWELAHVGDPVFDLAWAALRLYRGRSDLMSRLLPIPTALQRYGDRTGAHVEPDVLTFWTVFCYLRALAPHLRAAHAFESGQIHDVRLANMGHQSGHLLKFLAEELGLRSAPVRTARPDDAVAADDPTEPETAMMQNSPDRLLQGAADAVRDVLRHLDSPDPFVRSQLQATAELMDNLAPRIEWRADDLVELIAAIRRTLGGAVDDAPGAPLPFTRDVLQQPVDHTNVDVLVQQRDAHLAALRELQAWAIDDPSGDHPAIGRAVSDLLGWQLETELRQLRAGSPG